MTSSDPDSLSQSGLAHRDLVVAGWDTTAAGTAALHRAIAEAEERGGHLMAVPVHDHHRFSSRLGEVADRAAVIVLGAAHAGAVRRLLPHLTRQGTGCRVLLVDERGTVEPLARAAAD